MSHPDSHLHPHATGPAASVAEAHSTPQSLKIYAGWFCPFVQRVWLVLEEKKIPYQYIEVNPYNKPASLLSLNPRGLVPTLQYNNKPLYESTVICEFLEDAYPDHGLRLLPKEPYEKARVRIWIDFVTSRIIPAFHRFLQYQPPQGVSEDEAKRGLDKVRQDFLGKIKQFAVEIDVKGPFFLGVEPSLIDFALAPWAIRLWMFDHFKIVGLGVPAEGKGGEDEEAWRKWRRWVTVIETRKSVMGTTSEKEFYLPIYQR
ncbi:MAG: hypothetical protein M1836_002880 [Candelina mexicana]|nr:MAG: hypothetical protein M1836_002880 [Candelina mexicana]